MWQNFRGALIVLAVFVVGCIVYTVLREAVVVA